MYIYIFKFDGSFPERGRLSVQFVCRLLVHEQNDDLARHVGCAHLKYVFQVKVFSFKILHIMFLFPSVKYKFFGLVLNWPEDACLLVGS